MSETFREFVRYKLLSQGDLPRHPPKSPGSLVSSTALRATEAWFERQDKARTASKITKQLADAAFKVRRAPIKAKAAKARDAARHAEQRRDLAALRGVAVRTRTDCSAMSDEQKVMHHREVARLKKARQRATTQVRRPETFGIF